MNKVTLDPFNIQPRKLEDPTISLCQNWLRVTIFFITIIIILCLLNRVQVHKYILFIVVLCAFAG